jgi:drug/metabolite transporter (DMT)-like permease
LRVEITPGTPLPPDDPSETNAATRPSAVDPRPAVVLLLAVVGLSFAGPLVRLSHAHPLAIAAWRLGFSLIIVAAFLVATGAWREWRSLDRRTALIACGAGALLAIHFWAWNASVGLTTVAASVVLVNIQPAVVAALSAAWLRERPTARQWAGIAIAMGGAMIVVAPELRLARGSGRDAALGDALALLGGVTAALYYVAGRRLRGRLGLWPYVGLVYAACFVSLLALAAALGVALAPQPPRELAIFAALALGPMMLGHTGLNWALRYLRAYAVNVTVLGEPIGAALLAAALPGIAEVPAAATVAGGALILGGVLLTLSRS